MKLSELKRLLVKSIPAGLPILVKGAPGTGKSDIVAQACAEIGADLIISHPVVSDPTDYKGLPALVDGHARFLPFGDLETLINAHQRTVYFLDDLGQAPPSVQAACMQLLLARRINGHKVSDHVTFLAATNRREDRAGVSGLLEPVKSRFAAIIELGTDLDDWCKWALGSQAVPVDMVAFMRFRPGLLHDFKPSKDMVNSPCPRTWANAGRLIAAGLESYETITGAVGEGAAAEYLAFRKLAASLPNPDVIILDPDGAAVPSEPSAKYAICGALAARAKDGTFGNVIRYVDRIGAEFSVLTVKDALNRDESLKTTAAFIKWAVDKQTLWNE